MRKKGSKDLKPRKKRKLSDSHKKLIKEKNLIYWEDFWKTHKIIKKDE